MNDFCGKSFNMYGYVPKHFKIHEFVDPATYRARGDKAIALIDWRMLWTMDAIREYFDVPITINNWFWGGPRKWSGIRYANSDEYSQFSQHSYGRAIDFVSAKMVAAEMRKKIMDNPNEEAFQYITTIENFTNMNWVHIDCRVLRQEQKRYLIVGRS